MLEAANTTHERNSEDVSHLDGCADNSPEITHMAEVVPPDALSVALDSTTKVTAKGFLYLVKKYGKPGKTYQLPSIGVETTKPLPPAPAPTLFDGMAAE